MLPEESGFDFLKEIREKQNLIPVIMLTAMGDIDNKTQCFEGGCNDYLVKPFEPKELILRINNLLKNAKKVNKNICCFGEFIFDFKKQTLFKVIANDSYKHSYFPADIHPNRNSSR